MLTERQLEVVLAVVYSCIDTGEPVGSRTISRKYMTTRSAATIRNEMAELEEMGYLYQPHTSAGRMPTSKAYRLYVNTILQRRREPLVGLRAYLGELNAKRSDVEMSLVCASQLLGRITHSIGMAAIETLEQVRLQRVEFVALDSMHVMALLVLQGGMVHHKVICLPCEMSQAALEELSRSINEIAAGRPWSEVRRMLHRVVLQDLEAYSESCRAALDEMDVLLAGRTFRLFTGGAHHILELPDFQDLGRLQALLSILEEESSLAGLVQSCAIDEGVSVTIGEENPVVGMKNCSIVLASASSMGQRMVVGLIGPVRMDYERAISVLEGILPELASTAVENH